MNTEEGRKMHTRGDVEFDVYGRWQRERWVDPRHTRTKQEWPYSYDEFFIFGDRHAIKGDDVHGVYSDRLEQWDRTAFQRAAKPFQKRFEAFSRDECSQFLTDYYGKPTKCVALAEGCNVSNGYPYHIFWFTQTEGRTP